MNGGIMEEVSIDENGKVLITLEVKTRIIPVNGKFKIEGRSEKEFDNMFDAALYALELERSNSTSANSI